VSVRRSLPRRATRLELRVDWQACRGRGFCHELLPELVSLDDWGYPVIDRGVPDELRNAARRAVRGCPQLALTLARTSARAWR
jgi:ferredoxin